MTEFVKIFGLSWDPNQHTNMIWGHEQSHTIIQNALLRIETAFAHKFHQFPATRLEW